MDPNIAKIIASRVRKQPSSAIQDGAGSGIDSTTMTRRSPLKPRNFDAGVAGGSPRKAGVSPKKSAAVSESPSDTIKRILSRESLETNVKDLLSRESPGKNVVTRTYTSTSSTSPTRKTITKTVITEKEEKYEKKETISYSGNKEFIKEMESGKLDDVFKSVDETKKERLIPIDKSAVTEVSSKRFQDTRNLTPGLGARTPGATRKTPGPGNTPGPLDQTPTTSGLNTQHESEDFFSARKAKWAKLKDMYDEMEDDSFHIPDSGENSKAASPKKSGPSSVRTSPVKMHSPVKTGYVRENSPVKTGYVRENSPVKTGYVRERSPIKTNAYRFTSPEKKIASVSDSAEKSISSPSKSMSTSPVRVANITAKPFTASPSKARGISPVKAPVSPSKAGVSSSSSARIIPNPDDSLAINLKAQGFTETDSRSKLCYDFKEQGRERSVSPQKATERSCSPLQRARDRSASPLKGQRSGSPLKAGFTEQTRGRAPTRSTVLSSPTKSAVEPRSVSPHKPHPLQFVSPQVAAQAAAKSSPAPPPKPSRTYEAELANNQSESPSCRSVSQKRNMFDRPGPGVQPEKKLAAVGGFVKSVAASDALPDNRCDTPVRRSVAQKKTMFESQSETPERVDPAMLSMSDRKKLFEKNKSDAMPLPVARFGESVTPAMLAKSKPMVQQPGVTPAEAWKRKRELSPAKHLPPAKRDSSPSKQIMPPAKRPSPDSYIRSAARTKSGDQQEQQQHQPAASQPSTDPATPRLGQRAAEMHKRLFEKPDWRDNDIARQVDEQKKKDMDLLLNRYNHLKNKEEEEQDTEDVFIREDKQEENMEVTKDKASPEKYYPGVNSLKKVKVSPPKAGGLYPELYESDTISSTATTTSATAADTLNSSLESCATVNSDAPSLGMEIVALANRRTGGGDNNLTTIPEGNDSMETEEGDEMSESVCEEIDDMLDEALDDSTEDGSELMSPSKQQGSTSSSGSGAMNRCESSSSWEFHTPQTNRPRNEDTSRFKTPLVLMDKSPTRHGKEEAPVTHTVSFYRKQRPAHVTPVQRIVLNPVLEQSVVENVPSPKTTIAQKIKMLQNEAESQMSIITQSSNALALCRQTKEFYGSAEQVEGERLLLEATHKHNAALKEISRLKTEGGLGADPETDTSVRGTVCINSISLKLKKEFISQLRSGEADDSVHYFLCLVKCAGQVIPTQMLSTLNGLDNITLDFPNLIRLTDLPKNFVINLEVYGLQTLRESLDHETKYHIKKDKPGLFSRTPKILMGRQESRLVRPDVGSPKGPLAVRTSSFKIVGNTTITIENLKRKDWRLDSVPHVSPLEGAISFQLNCYSESQVKFRGFLTMFDDVSGYGAWHRRWFVLEGNRLSYWKYPENQKTQEPIGSIDLGACITENVTVSPRDICSRMNTFLLESRRPAKSSDRESLVLVRQGAHTIIRHLLSADSRDERLEWCSILNQALDNLRAWDPKEESRSETVSSTGSSETAASSVSTEIW